MIKRFKTMATIFTVMGLEVQKEMVRQEHRVPSRSPAGLMGIKTSSAGDGGRPIYSNRNKCRREKIVEGRSTRIFNWFFFVLFESKLSKFCLMDSTCWFSISHLLSLWAFNLRL